MRQLGDNRQRHSNKPRRQQRNGDVPERYRQAFAKQLAHRLVQRARGPEIAAQQRTNVSGVITGNVGIDEPRLAQDLNALRREPAVELLFV